MAMPQYLPLITSRKSAQNRCNTQKTYYFDNLLNLYFPALALKARLSQSDLNGKSVEKGAHMFGQVFSSQKAVLTVCGLLGSGLIMTSPASAASNLCNGTLATISSTDRVINGTSGDDVILVRGPGKHTVNAGAGNDLICSGNGAEIINGGLGNDVINSGSGNDVIDSGPGNDVIDSGSGNDDVKAGSGNDEIKAGSGSDAVDGGPGNDSINGESGNDSLTGNGGSDVIWGKDGKDSLAGGAGNDALQGGAGLDALAPGAGSNTCALDQRDQVSGNCTIDYLKPEVTNVSVQSSVTAGSTVTFLWNVTDTTGIGYTAVNIGGPSGWVTRWCGLSIEGTRISGSAQQGTYAVECDIPNDAVNTKYSLFVSASDLFGNLNYGTKPVDFTVTGGIADDREPTVKSVEVSSSTLSAGDQFTVNYQGSDESGIEYFYGYFYHDGMGVANERGTYIIPNYFDVTRISGDAKDGTWQQGFTVSEFAPAGRYTLYVGGADVFGNWNFAQSGVQVTVQ